MHAVVASQAIRRANSLETGVFLLIAQSNQLSYRPILRWRRMRTVGTSYGRISVATEASGAYCCRCVVVELVARCSIFKVDSYHGATDGKTLGKHFDLRLLKKCSYLKEKNQKN